MQDEEGQSDTIGWVYPGRKSRHGTLEVFGPTQGTWTWTFVEGLTFMWVCFVFFLVYLFQPGHPTGIVSCSSSKRNERAPFLANALLEAGCDEFVFNLAHLADCLLSLKR
jgi:hypothetical protein